jgi:transcriptional regulator with XRE-family HTH domain
MSINYAQIGKRVRTFRKGKDWTQANLAEATELSDTYVSLIENGRKGVSLVSLVKIAHALETTIDPLMLGNLQADAPQRNAEAEGLLSGCNAAQRGQIIAVITAMKSAWKDEESAKKDEYA